MEKFSLTRVTYFLLLAVLYCQQNTSATTDLCPSAVDVELVVSSKENRIYRTLPENSSYSFSGEDEFQIGCKSRSPVNITFQGLLPNPLSSSASARSTDLRNTSCHGVTITLIPSDKATGRYKCMDSSGNEKSVYIFAKGKESSSYLLNSGRGRRIDGSISGKRAVLPCQTTDPNVPVQLYKDGKNVTSREDINYDPMEGFSFEIPDSNDISYYGNYTCTVLVDSKKAYSLIVNLIKPITIIPDSTRNDTITLEVKGNEIRCNGASFMTFVNCNSPLECEFMRNCKSLPFSDCVRRDGQYCSSTNDEIINCLSINKNPDERGGLIFCSNMDPTLTKEFSFFTDFDDKVVQDLKTVSLATSKLVDFIPAQYNTWDDVDNFFQEEVLVFKCNASRLLFSQGIRWDFELRNGTVKPANILNETADIEEIAYSITSFIKFDDTNIVKLICSAPRIDSDEWHTLSKNISVRESSPPTMEKQLNEEIKSHEVNTTLNCSATGLPLPTITWRKAGDEDGDSIPPLRLDLNHNTTTSFLVVASTAKYICNATNFRGTKLKHYTVNFVGSDINSWLVIIASLVLVLVFTSIALLYTCFMKKHESIYPKEDIDNFFNGKTKPDIDNTNNPDYDNLVEEEDQYVYLPYTSQNEISNPEKNLLIEEEIGRGHFGVVHKGKLKVNGNEILVAVKLVKAGSGKEVFDNFLKELKFMSYVGNHPNVVKFIGGVTSELKKQQALIVVEYCAFNDLKNYLLKEKPLFQDQFNRTQYIGYCALNMPTPTTLPNYTQIAEPTTTSDLINWSYQIASGMEHLANLRLVHRDLAARNVLMNGQRVAKVTDFGLSRNLWNSEYYTLLELEGELLPLRWLAPEAMTDKPKFSTDSDIWAFGVTMWEIFSLGACPYQNIPNYEPSQLSIKDFLSEGRRMEKPAFANDALYEIMLNCWRLKGLERPRFSELKTALFAVGLALANDLSQPQVPSANMGISTSDFSLSDDENFDFDNEMHGMEYEDESG